ncbi:MAG: hypothetical protein ABIE22_01535, partial [archaeon]
MDLRRRELQMRLLRTISNDAWDSDILTEVSRESLQEIGDYRGIILLNTWKVPFGEDRDLYNYFLNKSQDCGKRVVAVMPYDSNLPQGGRGIAGLVPSG